MKQKKSRKVGARANIEPSHLLEIACQLMAKSGFHGTSFQSIADRAGISQTTVLHYFKDRTTFIKAAILHVVQSNRDFIEPLLLAKNSPQEKLRIHFRGNFLWAMSRPHQASVIILLYYMGSFDEDFAVLYREIRAVATKRIFNLLLEFPRKKALQTRTLEKTAMTLHDLLLGGLMNQVATQTLEKGEKDLMDKLDLVMKNIK